jgi:hypothetical protein
MQMADISSTLGWLVASPENRFGAGESSYVEKRMTRAGGGVCTERVADEKGAKSVQKGTENSKLDAGKCAYLRISARKCGFGEKMGLNNFEVSSVHVPSAGKAPEAWRSPRRWRASRSPAGVFRSKLSESIQQIPHKTA